MKTPTPVPMFVLTGFLGAGKTTLLAALLEDSAGPRTAVLVNEVGEVGLDHHLVERISEDVAVLPSGCICCTLRGALSARLLEVLELHPERVVLETTGLANPAPVLHALSTHPELSARLALAACVVALDAARGEPLVDAHPEALAQLAFADRVVLTKVDLAAPERRAALLERARREAPGAEILDSRPGAVPVEALWSTRPRPGLKDAGAVERWLDAHTHAHDVVTATLRFEGPVDATALSLWLRLVTQLDGPRLLRIKGLVTDLEGRVVLLESAEHAVSPPRVLPEAPAGWTGSALVVISRGMPRAAFERLEAAAQSAARGERA